METEVESFKEADSGKMNRLGALMKQTTRKSNAKQEGDTTMESNIKCREEMLMIT